MSFLDAKKLAKPHDCESREGNATIGSLLGCGDGNIVKWLAAKPNDFEQFGPCCKATNFGALKSEINQGDSVTCPVIQA
jgi:hypothetical protein